jgi:hypothetical protein
MRTSAGTTRSEDGWKAWRTHLRVPGTYARETDDGQPPTLTDAPHIACREAVRATKDVDVLAAQDRENLRRLAAALTELGARLRGVDAHLLPVDPTNPDDLGNGANWTLETDAGWLDYMSEVPGGLPYDEIRAAAQIVEVRGVRLQVVGLEHLVRLKRAAGRPRDLADIAALTPDQEL